MQDIHRLVPWVLLTAALVTTLSVWTVVFAREPSGTLTVAFLDVGQGDAIFIEAPNGTQVLVDGGKGRAVLQELSRLLPMGDRTLDVVIATHPDLDHIGGLPEVFARYEVGMFLEPGVFDEGSDYAALKHAVGDEGLEPIVARAGQVLALDEGVYLEILFPDRDVSAVEANTGSVVARLTYGESSFLLMGDAPQAIEEYLVQRYGGALQSTVLKLGHHGSNTSSGERFLAAVLPEEAVVSAGCDNSYGHPHREVVERVAHVEARVRQTCTEASIVYTLGP